jgi:integrase/recombinase XerD
MKNYREIMVRKLKCSALAPRTHQSYLHVAKKMFQHYSGTSPNHITEDMVTDWLILLQDKGYAPSTLTCVKCGLQFFYTDVIPRPDWTIFHVFKCGKRNDRRPSLTTDEVWRVLNRIRTPHNRAALTLIYLCGLRISECVNLEVGDIHSGEKRIHIHRGKGAKSRYIPLPDKALAMLKTYWKLHQNPRFVFPAVGKGVHVIKMMNIDKPMLITSLQDAFQRTVKEARIVKRRLSVHSLRHSYASHLIEIGVPTEHVRIFMGHKRLSTTEQYIHASPTGLNVTTGKVNILAEPYHEL